MGCTGESVSRAVGVADAAEMSVRNTFDELVALAFPGAHVVAFLFVQGCASGHLLPFRIVMGDAALVGGAAGAVHDAITTRDNLAITHATRFGRARRTHRGGRATANEQSTFEPIFRASSADFRAVDHGALVRRVGAGDEMRAITRAEDAWVRVAVRGAYCVCVAMQALRNFFAGLGAGEAACAVVFRAMKEQAIDALGRVADAGRVIGPSAAGDACAHGRDLGKARG